MAVRRTATAVASALQVVAAVVVVVVGAKVVGMVVRSLDIIRDVEVGGCGNGVGVGSRRQ